jgi:hypothetical protein
LTRVSLSAFPVPICSPEGSDENKHGNRDGASLEVWDISRGDWVGQPLKSTAERIMEVTQGKGRIVPGTAEEVDAFELDMHGRYDPQKSQRR